MSCAHVWTAPATLLPCELTCEGNGFEHDAVLCTVRQGMASSWLNTLRILAICSSYRPTSAIGARGSLINTTMQTRFDQRMQRVAPA